MDKSKFPMNLGFCFLKRLWVFLYFSYTHITTGTTTTTTLYILLMSIFIETLNKKQTTTTPVWLMRQAGRHLPEYRKIRSNYPNLMDMFLNPDEVVNITLQPVKRYNLDAAIIFSDILMVPYTLQSSVVFNEGGKGPVVNIEFNKKQKIEKAEPVFNAIKKVKEKSTTPLIGFAGGPWTTIFYCLFSPEERKKNPQTLINTNENKIDQLIERFTDATINYALNQIKSGIDVFQLFESWAGILNDEQFDKWCIQPTTKIFREIDNMKTPTIGFPRAASVQNQIKYSNIRNISCISLDYNFPLDQVINLNQKISYQGNLHPEILHNGGTKQTRAVEKILLTFKSKPHVFNLGHGVLPETPIKNVEELIKQVRVK